MSKGESVHHHPPGKLNQLLSSSDVHFPSFFCLFPSISFRFLPFFYPFPAIYALIPRLGQAGALGLYSHPWSDLAKSTFHVSLGYGGKIYYARQGAMLHWTAPATFPGPLPSRDPPLHLLKMKMGVILPDLAIAVLQYRHSLPKVHETRAKAHITNLFLLCFEFHCISPVLPVVADLVVIEDRLPINRAT